MKNKILQIHAKWLEKNGYTDGLAECKELASLVDIRQVEGRKKKRKRIKTDEMEQEIRYPTSTRSLINGKRHYDVTKKSYQCYDYIVSYTVGREAKSLEAWKARMGAQRADRIRDLSAMRGASMHTYLKDILRMKAPRSYSLGPGSRGMADVVIRSGLGDLEEVWGTEVTYTTWVGCRATDVVGIYDGRESIIDFKQTNKPKQREWIEDYFAQLGAYAMAHNQCMAHRFNRAYSNVL